MGVEITDYRIGDIGRIIALQTDYYEKHWQLGKTFETIISRDLAEFFERFDPEQDTVLIARDQDKLIGSMIVDAGYAPDIIQLRYFVISEEYQGQGLGRKIFSMAMDAALSHNRNAISLWTQDKLAPALALYESYGFQEVERFNNDPIWGQPLNRIRLEVRKPYELAA